MIRKIFLLLIALCFCGLPLMAEEGIITRFGKMLDGSPLQCGECPQCPKQAEGVVCPDTPIEEIKRPWFELVLCLEAFESPAGGKPQFHAANWNAAVEYNLSPVFYLYGRYSARTVEKIDYEGSVYDKTWSYQTFLGGAGFYIRPTLKIYAGLGKVIPKNTEGSEELSYALERGIAWDIPFSGLGYKLVVSFRSIEAPLASEDAHIASSQADGSTNILSVGLSIPLGYGQ